MKVMVPSSTLAPRFVWQITVRAVAGREAPEIRTITRVVSGILNTVRQVNASDVAVVLKIIREAVMYATRIEAHIGVVGEE